MNCYKYIHNCIVTPFKGAIYYYLYILNIISSGTILYLHNDVKMLLMTIVCSAIISYFETFFITRIPNKTLKQIALGTIIIFYNICIIIDVFLIHRFQMIINNTIIDILAVTNLREIHDFIITYLHLSTLLTISILLIFNLLIYKFSKRLATHNITSLFLSIISSIGLCIYIYASLNLFVLKANTNLSLTQCNILTRILYSYYYVKTDEHIGDLRHICKNLQTTINKNRNISSIVVIIGESHNLYHSSLYGYEKCTNPLLEKRVINNELFVFNDAVTIEDLTSKVMKSVFSLDSLGTQFNQVPLFPACFRSAGFYTALYDNEYFVDKSNYFLCNETLSNILFNARNTKQYEWDYDMISDIQKQDSIHSLYIIHLVGQHYAYNKRSPEKFKLFTEKDYPNKPHSQRKTIADYDNACLYNDYVLNSIIEKFENDNACIIYFADHGEEMFDIRNYCGHNSARNAPDIRYQIRIPLLIWTSSSFASNNKELISSLRTSQNYPITTDDISHTILDIGGIECKYFKPYRSFINKQYNKNLTRIVLDTINYDTYVSNLLYEKD